MNESEDLFFNTIILPSIKKSIENAFEKSKMVAKEHELDFIYVDEEYNLCKLKPDGTIEIIKKLPRASKDYPLKFELK